MANNNLDILVLKDLTDSNDKKIRKIPNILLKPPFLLVVCGAVRSGKGVVIVNLLLNKYMGYRDYFDEVIYISPTIWGDKTGRAVMLDETIHKVTDDLENIDEILETILESQKEDPSNKVLIVLDDMLGLLGSKHGYFSNLCSRYRHYNISIIVATQNFKSISPIVRVNATGWILFKTLNQGEYKKIEDELSGNYEDFEKLYKTATDKRYDFLFLDQEKIKAYHNFKKLLWEK